MLTIVLSDVDVTLERWLAQALGDAVHLRFDPPSVLASEPQPQEPTLDLFLYDIREDLTGRGADWLDVRDADGRVIARQPPLRRYDLSYLVTAWGAGMVADEHRLLGDLLACAAAQDVLPQHYLGGGLAELGVPLLVQVASPQAIRPASQLWADLGIPARIAVDLLVAAPLLPAATKAVDPLAERINLASSQNLS